MKDHGVVICSCENCGEPLWIWPSDNYLWQYNKETLKWEHNCNMKLTKEEEELILQKRAEEEEYKPKLMGFLKEDFYDYETNGRRDGLCFTRYAPNDFWLVTQEIKDKWIKEFTNHFKLVVKKGTKFVAYVDGNEEDWYDEINCNMEGMSKSWAKQYLENIQKYIP